MYIYWRKQFAGWCGSIDGSVAPSRATFLMKASWGNLASVGHATVPWRATEVYCRPMQSQKILCVPNGTYLTSKELSWVQALASITLNWKNIWIEKLCITLQMDVAGSKGDVCRVHIDLQAPNHTVYLNEHYVLQRMSSKHRDQHVQKQQTNSPLLLTTHSNSKHTAMKVLISCFFRRWKVATEQLHCPWTSDTLNHWGRVSQIISRFCRIWQGTYGS